MADRTVAEIIGDLNTTFAEFRASNDARFKAIEARGSADAVLVEKVERCNTEITRLVNELKAAQTNIEALASAQNRPGGTGGGTVIDKEYRTAFYRYMRNGQVDARLQARLDDKENKGAMVSSEPAAGYLCPVETEAGIDRVLSKDVVMRQIATTRNISARAFEKLVNKGGAAFGGWGNERTAPAETGVPQLAKLEFVPGTEWAEPRCTRELLEDSTENVEAWLQDEVEITFAEQEDLAFISGDGVEKPRGFLSYPTVANANYAWGSIGFVTSGAAGGFPAGTAATDKLIDMVHSLRARYRNGAGWLMNDLTMATIRKFKDGQGNYIWSPPQMVEGGPPELLLGYPRYSDDNMPDVNANAFPIAFANWRRAYLIVDRRGILVVRDDLTEKPWVKFWTTRRTGGGVQMFEAIKLMKVA